MSQLFKNELYRGKIQILDHLVMIMKILYTKILVESETLHFSPQRISYN